MNQTRIGSLIDHFIDRAQRRAPDVVIGGEERPYLRRWFVIPRNRVFNVYLHQFLRSDDDRALHSHPWLFNASVLLRGGYLEHTPHGRYRRMAGDFKFRRGRAWHRVQLLRPAMAIGNGAPRPIGHELPCWTLFITGPRVRQWGFDCDGRFVHWKAFTKAGAPGEIGPGCGE